MAPWTEPEQRTARLSHICGDCGRTITKGETYTAARGLDDGRWWSAKQCAQCGRLHDYLNRVLHEMGARDPEEFVGYGGIREALGDWAGPKEGHVDEIVVALFCLRWAGLDADALAAHLGSVARQADTPTLCAEAHTRLPDGYATRAGYFAPDELADRLIEEGWTVEQCSGCGLWTNWVAPKVEEAADA